MTSIEWTHVPDGKGGRKKGETVNPQVGCTEKSPGCRNCYAAKLAARGMSPQHRGLTRSLPLLDAEGNHVLDKHGRPKIKPNSTHWNGEVIRAPKQLEKPLRWREPRGIFWGSMTDLFYERSMATEDGRRYIAACLGVMAATQQHTHILVTKRAHLMREWFVWLDSEAKSECEPQDVCMRAARKAVPEAAVRMRGQQEGPHDRWPLPNVWLLTTTEDQKRADERIDDLLACPAVVHGVSVEPMLSRVVLPQRFLDLGKRAWVIGGGESGPGARPMRPDWARSLRDQCVEAKVPFFFKQWGEYGTIESSGVEMPEWTHMVDDGGRAWSRVEDAPRGTAEKSSFMAKVGKGKAGRLLDGRTWDEYPEVG